MLSKEWIYTLIVIACFLVIQILTKEIISRTLKQFGFGLARRKLTTKVFAFFTSVIAMIFITAIWGVDNDQFVLFISSVLTVLGVGFFAQWSILSNITAGIILFFNHPLKIGDLISIIDKDFPIKGRVTDITLFFIHITTSEGQHLTLPNSVVLYKTLDIHVE